MKNDARGWWLGGVALSVAVTSLGFNVYLLRRVSALSDAHAATVVQVVGDHAAEQAGGEGTMVLAGLTRLSDRLSALEAKAQGGKLAGAGATPEGATGGSTAAGSPKDAPVRYTHFEIPSGGLAVRQEKSGALSVSNRDPALEGKVMVVKALAEDGTLHDVSLLVPPAEK